MPEKITQIRIKDCQAERRVELGTIVYENDTIEINWCKEV